MNDRRFGWIGMGFVLASCQSITPTAPAQAATSPPVAYYQYAGSRQCERGGKSPQELQRELAAAGVQVAQVTCGHDGRMYAQACGGPDGRVLVALVPQERAAAAARLGLRPLADLPGAAPLACR